MGAGEGFIGQGKIPNNLIYNVFKLFYFMSWHQYQLLALFWATNGLFTFFYLLKVDAPFGRHTRAGWGPVVDNRLGWIIMEFTVLLVLFFVVAGSTRSLDGPVLVILGLFIAHYVHRSLIFPWFLRTRGKKMPVAIVSSAVGFNTVNGFLIGYYFGHFAAYPPDWFSDIRFTAGALVFALGVALNVQTDYALIRLRKPGERGYRIPRGGMFEWVSCPNHLGEILEWTGFAILSWSLPGAVFAFWTFANLAPRALAHHRWYKQQFAEYPKGRKALFPALW